MRFELWETHDCVVLRSLRGYHKGHHWTGWRSGNFFLTVSSMRRMIITTSSSFLHICHSIYTDHVFSVEKSSSTKLSLHHHYFTRQFPVFWGWRYSCRINLRQGFLAGNQAASMIHVGSKVVGWLGPSTFGFLCLDGQYTSSPRSPNFFLFLSLSFSLSLFRKRVPFSLRSMSHSSDMITHHCWWTIISAIKLNLSAG